MGVLLLLLVLLPISQFARFGIFGRIGGWVSEWKREWVSEWLCVVFHAMSAVTLRWRYFGRMMCWMGTTIKTLCSIFFFFFFEIDVFVFNSTQNYMQSRVQLLIRMTKKSKFLKKLKTILSETQVKLITSWCFTSQSRLNICYNVYIYNAVETVKPEIYTHTHIRGVKSEIVLYTMY